MPLMPIDEEATQQIEQAARDIAKEHANPNSRFSTLFPNVCELIATFTVDRDISGILTDNEKQKIAKKAFDEEIEKKPQIRNV